MLDAALQFLLPLWAFSATMLAGNAILARVNVRGGMAFFRFGRFGGSVYIAKRSRVLAGK